MSRSGLSQADLAPMHEVMAGYVERGYVPGLVTLLSRRGEVHVDAIGTKAFGDGEPMQRDTIFRIASVTKPITAAAAMILVEESNLRLDEPVDRLLPELANRRVLRSIDSPLDDTVPANRPITVRDVMTFRLGYGAVFSPPGRQYPIQAALEEAGVASGPLLLSLAPDEVMQRFGSLPLAHQPGEQWLYNSGSDILGVLIARAAGMSLGDFLQKRIFAPLGMNDTAFSVPAGKLHRLAGIYTTNFGAGPLESFDGIADSRWSRLPVLESGAGGLVSTADDLFKFAQMMLNGGQFEGTRILSRPSVDLMTTDHITTEQKAASASNFFPGFWESRGWGYGVSIVTGSGDMPATPGTYGWDGGYGTSWYVDPTQGLIGIILTQRIWDSPDGPAVVRDFWSSAYHVIERPS